MNPLLGRLERVPLREIWASEASDFTPWLATPENLAILGDSIGIDLELEAQEKNVGPFRADILCKDTDSSSWVLVENQLERTDHPHLGQLLTYAAGLQAVTIVWVAAQFTEEHRATLDWLNEITDERFQFFGLEVELWRIGSSPAAPKFNIVSKPNDWTRTVSQAARRITEESISETKALQLRYWVALRDLLLKRSSPVKPRTPLPQHWTNFSIGRSGFRLAATVNTMENRLGVELYIREEPAKIYFRLLEQQKVEIERQIGSALSWQELPDRKGARIVLFKEGCDPTNEAAWSEQQPWIADTLERFDKAFRSRVKVLNADDWEEGQPAAGEAA